MRPAALRTVLRAGSPDLGIECSVQKCQGASGVLLDALMALRVLRHTAPAQLLQPGRMSASSLLRAVFIGHSFPIADSSFARVDATHWVRLHGNSSPGLPAFLFIQFSEVANFLQNASIDSSYLLRLFRLPRCKPRARAGL